MTVFRLNPGDEHFPPPEYADPNGLLAVGGDLRPARLLTAYAQGIFPWYGEGQPILWHSPDPRFVVVPSQVHLSKSLRKTLRRGAYEVRTDTAFAEVIEGCAKVPRPGQAGTWITAEMKEAYVELHRLGFAHSVESWADGQLQGGLYGVCLGSAFFGESMFALAKDASKVAFAHLAERLASWDFSLIDCQVYTENLERFGAQSWSRARYLAELSAALKAPTRRGSWR